MELIRYQNRKLYDRDLAKYVTLAAVVEAVKLGCNFKVTAHSTGEDVTLETLKQAAFTHGTFTSAELRTLIKRGKA